MTTELGLNLAGVERVLELERQLERAQAQLEQMEARTQAMRAELEAQMEEVRQSLRADLVPVRHSTAVVRAADVRRPRGARTIPVERE
jgi:MerR family transcriptional regulator/heat shock protein HspR